jgi:hypothetical protein
MYKSVISWLFTPPAIRLYRWKIKNIPFERAEDFLKFSQKEGFTTHSQYLKTLDKLSEKSDILTQIFAYKVFGDRTAWANKYVNEARRLTKEEHDNVVIHPRFWAIPQDDVHARIAIRKYWED